MKQTAALTLPMGHTAPESETWTRFQQARLIVVFGLIYMVHTLDRTVFSVVIEPIKHEFGLSDHMVGAIMTLGYGIAFCIAGLPMGYLIDRVNRRNLLAGLLTAWSSLTFVAGFAMNGLHLMICRTLVGAAEAGSNPTMLSLLSDVFPRERRATVAGVIYIGAGMGAMLSGAAGGMIAHAYGWRYALFLAGIPGIVLAAVLILTLREPKRGATDTDQPSGGEIAQMKWRSALSLIVRHPILAPCMLAGACQNLAISAIGTWMTPFLSREHGLDLREAGFGAAAAVGLGVAAGAAIGGWVGDLFARKSAAGRMYVCSAINLFCIPIGIAAFLSPSALSVVALLTLWCVIAAFHVGSTMGTIVNLLPPSARGTGTATYQVIVNLLGYGMGPYLVGVASDIVGGPHSLRDGLLIIVTTICCLALLFYILAARGYRAAAALAVPT